MDVYESMVKILEDLGIGHVFGGSGQSNASMMLALNKSEKLKTVIIRNEQAASFMACGYAMFSDQLGVCFTTGGPGAFNIFSGLAVAYSDSLPVLGITGYPPKAHRGKGPLNGSSGLNRTPDSHAMFAATTKKAYIIEDPNETCDIMEDAINTAFEGRPGPVHIHVPKDVGVQQVENFRPIKLDIKPVLPDPKMVNTFADVLAEGIAAGKKILAMVGYGAIRSHAEAEVLAFVEKFQVPFVTTMDGKGALPEDHPLSLGISGASGDPGANAYLEQADIVLALGNSFAQFATFSYKQGLYDNKVLMHVNIDKNELSKVYKAQYELLSDIKPAIVGINDALSKRINSKISPPVLDIRKFYDIPPDHKCEKIDPAALVKVMSENLPENAIVTGDAGGHMLWLNCYLKLAKNQRYQNPGSFGPMASHVNGAMGIKCANPDKVVISGCGDGGYLMAGFELLTAVQYDIPVVWVIFNNGEFNIIKKFLLNAYNEHAFMQFGNPDYVAYAKACGAHGFRVEKLEDFADVFNKAVALNKPVLIDVVVDGEVFPPFSLGNLL